MSLVRKILQGKDAILRLGCGARQQMLRSRCYHSGRSTVNEAEINKFSLYAETWWDEGGEATPLHALNELRVPLVKNGLQACARMVDGSRPLAGLRILDVGCGGGILSEPLARLGASVTGIDAAEENVQVAAEHASRDIGLNAAGLHVPQYRCCTVEQLAAEASRSFDAVIASEVLEHVDNQPLFVQMCCHLLKPGGSLFITTLNRTRRSWLLAIVAAEYVARVLPVGTHQWNNFITPSQLHGMVTASGLVLRLQHGMCYNPASERWSWSADSSCSYAVHAVAPF